jgi:hypothetical protein
MRVETTRSKNHAGADRNRKAAPRRIASAKSATQATLV